MNIKGFSTSAVAAGIRYSDRLDLGLIYSDVPAVTAGVFTTNQVKAAPVVIKVKPRSLIGKLKVSTKYSRHSLVWQKYNLESKRMSTVTIKKRNNGVLRASLK